MIAWFTYADSLFQYYGDKYTSIKQYVVKRCNQKCRDRARDKNKPRRSSGKKRQQKSTLELQVESLLYGQQQLMRAMTDLSFPAVHVRNYYNAQPVVQGMYALLLICSMMCPPLKVLLTYQIPTVSYGIWIKPSPTEYMYIRLLNLSIIIICINPSVRDVIKLIIL